MHKMDEDGLTKAVHRLETAALGSDDTRDSHFKEVIMNVLHEHARAFEQEMRDILVREARFKAIEDALCEMLGCDPEGIPKGIAQLRATIAELEQQV